MIKKYFLMSFQLQSKLKRSKITFYFTFYTESPSKAYEMISIEAVMNWLVTMMAVAFLALFF